MPPPTIPERLRFVDWDELLPRLHLAASCFHDRYLRTFAAAPDPVELTQDAVTDLLTCKRALPEDLPLFVILHEIIRSKVSNYVARQQSLGRNGSSRRHIDLEALEGDDHPSTKTLPDPLLQRQILELVKGDDLLEQIVELLLADPLLKAADLAAMLEIDVRDVYRANRRLKRRLSVLRSTPDKIQSTEVSPGQEKAASQKTS